MSIELRGENKSTMQKPLGPHCVLNFERISVFSVYFKSIRTTLPAYKLPVGLKQTKGTLVRPRFYAQCKLGVCEK